MTNIEKEKLKEKARLANQKMLAMQKHKELKEKIERTLALSEKIKRWKEAQKNNVKRNNQLNQESKNAEFKIIEGLLPKLPIQILTDSQFIKDKEIKSLLTGKGIYIMFNKEMHYYVGQDSNLPGRLITHLTDKHKGKWTHFIIVKLNDRKLLHELEALMLLTLRWVGNDNSAKVPYVADGKKQFNRILDQKIDKLESVRQF